jgi:hypothetical protein
MHKYEEAEPLLVRNYDFFSKFYGVRSARTRDVRQQTVNL